MNQYQQSKDEFIVWKNSDLLIAKVSKKEQRQKERKKRLKEKRRHLKSFNRLINMIFRSRSEMELPQIPIKKAGKKRKSPAQTRNGMQLPPRAPETAASDLKQDVPSSRYMTI